MQTYRVNRFNFKNLPNFILPAIFGLLTTTVEKIQIGEGSLPAALVRFLQRFQLCQYLP